MKSLAGVIVIALIGLVLFGVAAYTVTENPRVKLKIALEREVHVRVRPLETVTDPRSQRAMIRVRVSPAGPTPTAEQLDALAARTAALVASLEPAQALDFDAIEVVPVEGPATTYERSDLERRLRLEALLPEAERSLAKAWSAPVRLSARSAPRANLPGVDLGVALEARPPGDREDAALGDQVLAQVPLAAFVSIPAREPGAAPVVRRRAGRR